MKITINVYTDNWSLSDTLQSPNNVTDKRLQIDIAVAKKNIEKKKKRKY